MAFYSGNTVKESPKKKSKFIPVLLFILALLGTGAYFLLTNKTINEKVSLYRCYFDGSVITKSSPTATGIQKVSILEGQDPLAVGKTLQSKGVINSANDFLCYVRKIEAGDKIQAGYYEIQLPVTIEQLVPMLQSSDIPTFRVTIPEGLRYDEIAKKIDSSIGTDVEIKKFSSDEFIALATDQDELGKFIYTRGKSSFEGFLFPDTYDFKKSVTSQEVLTMLTSTFMRKVADASTLDESKALTPYQIIVLASLIEKEAGKSFEEKQIIAGIITKRLTSGWLLQVDATLLYENKDWKAPIFEADKSSDSLYNSYKRMGLPPTPICNPGLDSVKAALSPKTTPYWFYLHGTDGVVRYGKTNAEHIQNISLYLR